MNDYTDIFDRRGDLYNQAEQIQPLARNTERQTLINLLELEPHHIVCDVPAGGGYLADGVRNYLEHPVQVICVEPSRTFAQGIDNAFTVYVAQMNELPIVDNSVNRVGSLAGLHHLADKAKFFSEAHRILKDGGIFAVADVLEGTPVAGFLNGPVDRYSITGHRGLFLKKGEFVSLLEDAGFDRCEEQHVRYFWTFDSEEKMLRYCKSMFGLVNANLQQIKDAIDLYFTCEVTDKGVNLPWSLLYATGNVGK